MHLGVIVVLNVDLVRNDLNAPAVFGEDDTVAVTNVPDGARAVRAVQIEPWRIVGERDRDGDESRDACIVSISDNDRQSSIRWVGLVREIII